MKYLKFSLALLIGLLCSIGRSAKAGFLIHIIYFVIYNNNLKGKKPKTKQKSKRK